MESSPTARYILIGHFADGSIDISETTTYAPVSDNKSFKGTYIREIFFNKTYSVSDGPNLQNIAVTPENNTFIPANQPASESTVGTRLWGLLKAVGGAFEAAGGAAIAGGGAEIGIAIPIGYGIMVHGSDVFAAGMQQLLTGKDQSTLTQQGISSGLQSAGVSPDNANTIANYTDMGISMAGGMYTLGSKLGATATFGQAGNLARESRLALGVRENLDDFAKTMNASTHRDWGMTNFAIEFEDLFFEHASKAKEILFNLTLEDGSMLNVQGAITRNPTLYETTDWELKAIFTDKALLEKTKFFLNGEDITHLFR